MESKGSQQGSTGVKPTQGRLLEKLDLVTAPCRAPKKVIAKVYDLTSIELLMLGDLAEQWAKIEGDVGEESLTVEMLETFLKAVFKRWDSGSGAPHILDEPRKRKREMSVVIGTWASGNPESIASQTKRKREGKDESEVKEAKARKTGANAWLAVSTEHPEVLKFEFRDNNQRMVSQIKMKVDYLPDIDLESAQVRSIRVYGQAEAARAEDFNKGLLIALAHHRIVAFSKNGDAGENSPPPLIAAAHQLNGRLFTPVLGVAVCAMKKSEQLSRLLEDLFPDQRPNPVNAKKMAIARLRFVRFPQPCGEKKDEIEALHGPAIEKGNSNVRIGNR